MKRRKILVKDSDGEFIIRVPEDAKLTFGPAIPFERRDGEDRPRRMEYALRVYRGTKDNLVAVFSGVRMFRDLIIGIDMIPDEDLEDLETRLVNVQERLRRAETDRIHGLMFDYPTAATASPVPTPGWPMAAPPYAPMTEPQASEQAADPVPVQNPPF